MNKAVLLKNCFFGFGLFLLPVPIFLLVGAAQDVGVLMLLPLAAAILLGAGIRCLKPRFRVPFALLSAVLCFILAWFLGRGAENMVWCWVGAAFSAIAALMYPRYLGLVTGGGHISEVWYGGLAVIAVMMILGKVTPVPGADALLNGFTWVYCIYLVFVLTAESLSEGIGAGRLPSRAMVVKNGIAALGWTGLFLLVTHIPQISHALRTVLDMLKWVFVWVMQFLSRLMPSGMGGMGGAGGGVDFGMLDGEMQDPSMIMKFLEKAVRVLGLILAGILLIFLLRLIWKALVRAIRALIAHLRAYINAVNENYEDQVESLLDWGEVKREFRARRLKRQQARQDRVPWNRLSPRQQVRRSYRDFLVRHPDVGPSSTARQTLSDPRQAGVYEAARYSSREITPEDVQAVRDLQEKR